MTVMIRRQDDWLSTKTGNELIMMNVEKGHYLGLTDVGTRIWELTETPLSLDELCASLVVEFEVTPDQCRADVLEFLDHLAKHGAIVLDDRS
jgi:hypothetical protein